LCLVICCGAVGVGAWRLYEAAQRFVADMATDDPDEVRKKTAEMVDIDIPDTFQPKQAVDMIAMRMAVYQTEAAQEGTEGMLVLMEMGTEQMGIDPDEQEKQLRESMQQQHADQDFNASKSETRQIEIRGEKMPFEFTEGTSGEPGEQQKKTHMVSGVIRGKRGPVMVQIVLPEDDYDEAAVMEMLQSIK
jgi:hypothetical protein